jgi:predicted nucleic acid-binding protein
MFTVDASVHLNALNPAEPGSAQSRAFLEALHQRPWPVHSPTLLLVEVAGAVARVQNDPARGVELSRAIHELPGQMWMALDEALAAHAAALASGQRLRGADAVYAGVASHHGTTLVTRDREQLERLPPIVPTMTPEEALARLRALEASGPES